MFQVIEGYAPDLDTTIPGIIVDCSNWIPSTKGYEAAPSFNDMGLTSLSQTCMGAAVLQKLDGTTRFLAGTDDEVREDVNGTWTTRSSGHTCTTRWRFAVQGNICMAVNKSVNMIASETGTLSASAVSSAPKANYIETVGDFVFLADYNDGTDTEDGVYWSALGDYTDWTTSIATQCGNVRLYGSPGKITGIKRFGDGIAIYKKQSIYLGVYVGPPKLWEFREIPGDYGALSNEAIVDIGTAEDPRHLVMSKEQFIIFDGVKVIPVGDPLKKTVFDRVNQAKDKWCQAVHDRFNYRVYFWYPTSDTTLPDKCVVYNYRTNKWGRYDNQIQSAVEYIESADTYADVGTDYSTYEDLNNGGTYGDTWAVPDQQRPAIFNTSNKVMKLNGTPGTSTVTSGDFGDDNAYTLINRVKPRYLTAPSSATMDNFYRHDIGDSLTTDVNTSQSSNRFDVRRSARWHRVRLNFTGSCEMNGVDVQAKAEGNE